jgi:hypothetical protein
VKLRIQLPILNSSESILTVDGVEHRYFDGEPIIFDDSFQHSVRNCSSKKSRVVLLIDIWHPDLSPEHIHRLLTRFPSSPSSQSESQFDSELNSFSAATITTAAHNMIEMGEGRFIVPPQSVRLEDGLLSVSVPRIDLRSTPQSAPPVTAAHLESKITFKIVLLGDTSVGKSCFLLRYFDDQFNSTFITTIGVDFVRSFFSPSLSSS